MCELVGTAHTAKHKPGVVMLFFGSPIPPLPPPNSDPNSVLPQCSMWSSTRIRFGLPHTFGSLRPPLPYIHTLYIHSHTCTHTDLTHIARRIQVAPNAPPMRGPAHTQAHPLDM